MPFGQQLAFCCNVFPLSQSYYLYPPHKISFFGVPVRNSECSSYPSRFSWRVEHRRQWGSGKHLSRWWSCVHCVSCVYCAQCVCCVHSIHSIYCVYWVCCVRCVHCVGCVYCVQCVCCVHMNVERWHEHCSSCIVSLVSSNVVALTQGR